MNKIDHKREICMDSIFTSFLYGAALVLLVVSFVKNTDKTLLSLKMAWKMFINILPQFVTILLLIGLMLAVIRPETIQRIIGAESGFRGMMITSFLGSIVFVPVLIVFPIAADLLKNGAGAAQIAVFISTLTMVGFKTLPIEIKYLGRKIALYRNALSFLFAFITAFIIGVILT